MQLLHRLLIQRWVVEWVQVTVPCRESSHTFSGVPVQNAAGAITIKHLLNFAVRIRRGIDTRRQCDVFPRLQRFDHGAPRSKLTMLFHEVFKVGESRRVDQLKAIEMGPQACLLGRGAEEQ